MANSAGLIPEEILAAWGDLPYIRPSASDEFQSACPECGTAGHDPKSGPPDRFFIKVEWGNPERTRGICRRCGYKGFAMNVVRQGKHRLLDPAKLQALHAERERQLVETAQLREKTRLNYSQNRLWARYHDAMGETQREWWRVQGVPNEWQDFWRVGWTASLFSYGPAFTLPIFWKDWDYRTTQYRLEHSPESGGRYRFEPDLGSAAFLAQPQWPLVGEKVYVVEGGKKAMVTHLLGTRARVQVVGFPSVNSDGGMLDQLRQAKEVVLILDPDTWDRPAEAQSTWVPWPVRWCREIGSHARALRWPVKIDDALRLGYMRSDDLASAVRFARPYA